MAVRAVTRLDMATLGEPIAIHYGASRVLQADDGAPAITPIAHVEVLFTPSTVERFSRRAP